jgi:hypothetical protein
MFPLMIWTGLAMSPAATSVIPFMVTSSAFRSTHPEGATAVSTNVCSEGSGAGPDRRGFLRLPKKRPAGAGTTASSNRCSKAGRRSEPPGGSPPSLDDVPEGQPACGLQRASRADGRERHKPGARGRARVLASFHEVAGAIMNG